MEPRGRWRFLELCLEQQILPGNHGGEEKHLILHHFNPPLAPLDRDSWRQAGGRAPHWMGREGLPGWVPRCPECFGSHVHLPEEPRPHHPWGGGWGS